jgi:hypothetical protein
MVILPNRNDYSILVYYRENTGRYDRVGKGNANSLSSIKTIRKTTIQNQNFVVLLSNL